MAFALGNRVHIHADDHFAGWLFGGRYVVQRLAANSITATILSNLGWSTVTLRSEVFTIADFALNITSTNDDVNDREPSATQICGSSAFGGACHNPVRPGRTMKYLAFSLDSAAAMIFGRCDGCDLQIQRLPDRGSWRYSALLLAHVTYVNASH